MTGTAALTDVIVEAVDNLRGQGRRSLLALLGVVIGSAAIVALLNLGHMAQLETLKRFRQTGVDMLQLQVLPTGSAAVGLDPTALEAAAAEPGVVQITPLALTRLQVRVRARQVDTAVAAVPPAMARVAGFQPAAGRLLGPIDDCGSAAVVGAKAALDLSAPGAALTPGDLVMIGDYGFTVVGLLRPVPMEVLSPLDYDQAVLVPLACARRVLTGSDPTAALVRLRLDADATAVGARLSMRLVRPGMTIQVRDARALIRTMKAQSAVHSRLLAAIGSISLLVGGIGVMNVMLMTVMERRREIGLRAAVGARPRDIWLMFLVEGVILSVGGGALGAALGVAATAVVAKLSHWTFDVALWVLPLGPGMAAVVGLAFGLYPAIAASRIHPVEALRAD